MKLPEMLQAAHDFWRPNRYGLKPYLVNDGKKHPFAVICPGGGYSMVCSFVEGKPFAQALNERGYHAFVVYYRVKRKALYPAPHDDLERAIREIFAHREEWKLDTADWSLWGSSAGGHLAASFCLEERSVPRPSTLVLSYPVITMTHRTHSGSRDWLIGKVPDPALIDALSVEKHVTVAYPPTYVWNGTADELVDPMNSQMLATALAEAGIPCRYERFEGVGHGVGLARGTAAEPWFDYALDFWQQQGGAR